MGTHGEPLAQNSELLCMVLSLLCMRVVLDARASYRSQSHMCGILSRPLGLEQEATPDIGAHGLYL